MNKLLASFLIDTVTPKGVPDSKVIISPYGRVFFCTKTGRQFWLTNFASHNSRLLLFLFQPAVCALFCLLVTF